MQLRDYQQWFRHHILEAMRAGNDSVLAVLPTGGGKRYSIVDLCLLALQHGRQVLVATNRRLLVDQMAKECAQHGVSHGVLMSDYERGSSASPIQIASIQSLQSWFMKDGLGAKYGEGLPEWDLLLIDEAHNDLKRYAQLRAFRPQAKVVGFTATPVGPEGRAITPLTFNVMVEGAKNSELIQREFLLPTRVFTPSEPHLKGVNKTGGREYNQNQLSRAVRQCTVAGDVFKEFEKFPGRATVVFAPGVPFARDLERQFNDRYGPSCASLIEADTDPHEREDIFGRIKDGSSQVLLSVDIMKEGADLPVLSMGIDLQPNSQLRTFWQKVGRIKRAYEGQKDAVLIDLAGNLWEHIHPDLDPEWPVGDDTTTQATAKSKSEQKTPEPICCPKCGHSRLGGKSCPECGFEGWESVRRVRMGVGQLREVHAHEMRKKSLSAEERLFNKWKSRLFAAMHSGLSYGQCAAIFKREHGESPRHGWPGTFPAHALDWKRSPAQEHTTRTLSEVCRRYQEKLK